MYRTLAFGTSYKVAECDGQQGTVACWQIHEMRKQEGEFKIFCTDSWGDEQPERN